MHTRQKWGAAFSARAWPRFSCQGRVVGLYIGGRAVKTRVTFASPALSFPDLPMKSVLPAFAPLVLLILLTARAAEPAAVPERVVVLTFDDSVASHATYVAPLLRKLGFGATFFITEGFEFTRDKEHYMTWEQIQGLHAAGFEIGNHTRRHIGVARQKPEELKADVEYLEQQCARYGIPRPVSFCYPGYQTSPAAVQLLRERGYLYARAGGASAVDPLRDEPLTFAQAFDGKPESTLEQFQAAVAQARGGKIVIMTFHGVPDIKHPWVNTDPAKFERYMNHLKEQGCRVIALRDVATLTARR